MTGILVLLSILVVIVLLGLSFLAGVRFCASALLPSILAKKTPEELRELAREAADQLPE